jgi:hypothetical protein
MMHGQKTIKLTVLDSQIKKWTAVHFIQLIKQCNAKPVTTAPPTQNTHSVHMLHRSRCLRSAATLAAIHVKIHCT